MNPGDPNYEFLHARKAAYQRAFKGASREALLHDLSRFCRAHHSCVVPGDRDRTLLLEGRREVWLRIQEHITLSIVELAELYGAVQLQSDAGPQRQGDE